MVAKRVYGFCPICGEHAIRRQRRLDGDDTCVRGHVYKSSQTLAHRPDIEPDDAYARGYADCKRDAVAMLSAEAELLSGDMNETSQYAARELREVASRIEREGGAK